MILLGAVVRCINRRHSPLAPMPIRHDPLRTPGARAFLLATPASLLPAGAELPARADALRPLLVGELHGMQEIPALLTSMLRQGGDRPWLLGLEIPCAEQARVDAFLRSDGGPHARGALRAGAFWTREAQDGRSGTAMLRLIDAVRALNRSGRDIRVVCFDDLAPTGERCDAHLAAALRDALRAERHRRALARAGDDPVHLDDRAKPQQEFPA